MAYMEGKIMAIGDRVKVIDQEIIGTIIRHDVGNKVVILYHYPHLQL